jgi:hypothetical protein
MHHSARLLDAAGAPLNGPRDLAVRLLDAGGAPVHAESFPGLAVADGYVSLTLGGAGDLDAAELAAARSVELSVAGQVLSTSPIGALPRAAHAAVADEADHAATADVAVGLRAAATPPAVCNSAAQEGLTWYDSANRRFYGCFGTQGWRPLLADTDVTACWDLDRSGTCNGGEDVTGDGRCTVLDCWNQPAGNGLVDVAWGALHAAAAAACRGSTASGGTGCCGNSVRVRNTASGQTCSTICSANSETCDAEVSVWGRPGKATANGEFVGNFYNYGCGGSGNGGSEASASASGVLNSGYWSFCCCRK